MLMALVMFFAPLMAGFTRAQERQLPAIGGLGGGLLSDQMEAEIGQQVMSSIRRSANQIHDPLVNEYLTSLVYRLVPYAPLNNRTLTMWSLTTPALTPLQCPATSSGSTVACS